MTHDFITPEQLLAAYANGYFPMAMAADDPELYWFAPEERGVLPLDRFNIPRGLKRAMKTHAYRLTVDRDFAGVITGCASVSKGRHETWINQTIVDLYTALHRMGHAHSVEVWGVAPPPLGGRLGGGREETPLLTTAPPHPSPYGGGGASAAAKGLLAKQSGEAGFESSESISNPQSLISNPESPALTLLGGLYGVSIGGAFFGESMFSRAPEASKMALVLLVELLNEAGYMLLDTQYVNTHLQQFGVEAVAKADYMMKLEKALSASPNPSTRFSTASVRRGLASSSSDNVT